MQLAVALDLESENENLQLVERICESNKGLTYKVGLRSFIRDGKSFILKIREIDPEAKIFLDLKLYDIPNTVDNALSEVVSLGVDYITVHSSCGQKSLASLAKYTNEIQILLVTALTSFSQDEFAEIYNQDITSFVKTSTDLAMELGFGLVCSGKEAAELKKDYPNMFFCCPGIRDNSRETLDDQTRTVTVDEARQIGIDMIVVGRPIYSNSNPDTEIEKYLF